MKAKAQICLIAILCCLSQVIHANIFRVDSSLATKASQKLFKEIKEMHDHPSVLAGGTLMIKGSRPGTHKLYYNLTPLQAGPYICELQSKRSKESIMNFKN